jgi:hypothetical protein
MSIQNVLQILSKNDGSLPDIEFDFGLEKCVATAYQVIQNHSSYINSLKPYYWSRLNEVEVPIIFGQNPAEILLTGDAEPFHLVFGGIISPSGENIPDLGVFVLGETVISLDYKMGEYWNLTFPVKSEDSSEERCYAGVDLMIEMEWAHGFR